MSKNIKEIGKDLLGKSLNSFHRKVGLESIEKNNEMQDGILDGILSQVDDAYISKAEQSNVIHLDGSGDGVVVVDSIEGNTMVNILNNQKWVVYGEGFNANCPQRNTILKPSTTYTYYVFGFSNKINPKSGYLGSNFTVQGSLDVSKPLLVTTNSEITNTFTPHLYPNTQGDMSEKDVENIRAIMIEGNHLDKDLNFFEGMKSCFEETVNEQGLNQIEILLNNENIMNINSVRIPNCPATSWGTVSKTAWAINIPCEPNTKYFVNYTKGSANHRMCIFTDSMKQDFDEYASHSTVYKRVHGKTGHETVGGDGISSGNYFTTPSNAKYLHFTSGNSSHNQPNTSSFTYTLDNISVTKADKGYIPHKLNKIKLLVNEPLRGLGNVKDRLCVKDGKLVVERKYRQQVLNGGLNEKWVAWGNSAKTFRWNDITDIETNRNSGYIVCDKIPRGNFQEWWNGRNIELSIDFGDPNSKKDISSLFICHPEANDNLQVFRQWLSENNLKVIVPLKEPIYEEVLNEYGEPILMEGYENGTIYIDSTIVPSTTVRYTPKMESFKEIKTINKNNNLLSGDINENIVPYMMDVDMMIMEKEMAIMSHKNIKIRKMEVLDMTSMQKRTFDMLKRLIEGKSLTKEECKIRVTTYLDAKKITDEQASELMLVISETYGE